jgi:hypothetical protein
MRCGHIFENPPHVPHRPCGQETEQRCSHCEGPRCTDHGMKIDGTFLCLAAARERARNNIPETPDLTSRNPLENARWP